MINGPLQHPGTPPPSYKSVVKTAKKSRSVFGSTSSENGDDVSSKSPLPPSLPAYGEDPPSYSEALKLQSEGHIWPYLRCERSSQGETRGFFVRETSRNNAEATHYFVNFDGYGIDAKYFSNFVFRKSINKHLLNKAANHSFINWRLYKLLSPSFRNDRLSSANFSPSSSSRYLSLQKLATVLILHTLD